MSKLLKDDLHDFRIKEKASPFPAEAQAGIRISKPMKQRLTKLSMAQGVSESQLCRFLILKGLATYDIDGLLAS